MITALTRSWFRLDRHDVRSTLPAAIQAIMQNGLLERVFREALQPGFLFPSIADVEPWAGGLGDTKVMTRKGLIAPTTTPVTGSDAPVSTYNVEQWSVTMDQYGTSIDTNMLQSRMALASKYLADVKQLGIQAGQSLNRIARSKLFGAYIGGRTWATAASTSSTTLVVDNVGGFSKVLVNGVPTAVSASTPLSVTVNGVGNTVTGINTGTNTLTLGTAISASVGWAVVAANAPVSIRATGSSAYDLTGSNTVTFAQFRAAVARLRKMNVPTLPGGYYAAHIDPDTETQLFADSDFKLALQGRIDSPVYRDLSIGRFAGIDWIRNNEMPTRTNGGSTANLTVHQPIVMGASAIAAAPFEDLAGFLMGTGVEDVPEIRMINVAPGADVALIVRPPQDRFQQVVSTTWGWVGDYGIPSDSLANGDPAIFKRAVVIEHT
ncbi:hypothetical protein [Streptomyces griseofuscus]|uniref:hypothetical protein n=1 Tax=Streptomyces griseofuscus TaxID=146922 RepID=UPI0033D22650